MNDRHSKAKSFVVDHLNALCPGSEVDYYEDPSRNTWNFRIEPSSAAPVHVVELKSKDLIFLESVLKGNDPWAYKTFIRFLIYQSLGPAGLMPSGFKISDEFIKEERATWWEDQMEPTNFDEHMTQVLVRGLYTLRPFLSDSYYGNKDLSRHLELMGQDVKHINDFIDSYGKEKHLNFGGVSVKRLSLLKTAAIVEIMGLEDRKTSTLPNVLRALDKDIYQIVACLRDKFLEVRLPEWFRQGYRDAARSGAQENKLGHVGAEMQLDHVILFLSSPCSGLRDLRAEIAAFLESRGATVAHNEAPQFHDGNQGIHPHDVCLRKVDDTPIFLSIVDTEAGSLYEGVEEEYRGLTVCHAELKRALKKKNDKRIFVFVRQEVLVCYEAWKDNGRPGDFKCQGVERGVYRLLEDVIEKERCWREEFVDIQDLKSQLAAKLRQDCEIPAHCP